MPDRFVSTRTSHVVELLLFEILRPAPLRICFRAYEETTKYTETLRLTSFSLKQHFIFLLESLNDNVNKMKETRTEIIHYLLNEAQTILYYF